LDNWFVQTSSLINVGYPRSSGYTAGFHARAKLRLFQSTTDPTKVWLYIDQLYGDQNELLASLPQLAKWWQRYCKRKGWIPHEILRPINWCLERQYYDFTRVWKGETISYPTKSTGGRATI
jgi:hypothetical protein